MNGESKIQSLDQAGGPLRGRLFRKFAIMFVGLVGSVLVASGAMQAYFSYQENTDMLVRLQREKAVGAATVIKQFTQEIENQIAWSMHASFLPAGQALAQRRIDFLRLLRQSPAITEISLLDASGKEQLKISRLSMDVIGSGKDFSADPKFTAVKRDAPYVSPVYFRQQSEPYVTLSMAGSRRSAGVTVAEVNLKLIWDEISNIRAGKKGYAYVVDSRGLLIAHPDIGLVLRKTNLSSLSQVRAAREDGGEGAGGAPQVEIAEGISGGKVLTAHARIERLGWTVFVESPLGEAFEPIYDSLFRTGVLILFALVLAAIGGVVLARRVTVPIQALQEGATRIGAGNLSSRIEVRTGDELEVLAEEFNAMASDLQASYATLERRVEERTAELSEALEQLEALGEVGQAVSSTLDLNKVLETIVAHAVELSDSDAGNLWVRDEVSGEFQVVSSHGFSGEYIETMRGFKEPPQGGASYLAIKRRAPVEISNILNFRTASPVRELMIKEGNRAVLAVPLMREDQVVGTLVISRKVPGPFGEKVIDLIQTFANQSVLPIQNARLYRDIEERTAELRAALEQVRALSEVGQAVSSSLDLQNVLDTIVAHAAELSDSEAGTIWVLDEEMGKLKVAATRGFSDEHARELMKLTRMPQGGTSYKAMQRRVPVEVPDMLDETGTSPVRDLQIKEGFRAHLSVPLVREDEVVGTLVISRKRPGPFGKETIDLLQTFANQSVLPIQNARLFQDIEEKGRQIEIASQHKSQFLANMSHELRTPLNAILGYTELILDEIYGPVPEKVREVLGRVTTNGKHLLGLINEVLDLSKIEAGELELAIEPYSMADVVHTVAIATESLAKEKNLGFTINAAPGLPTGKGDERRIAQVLLNLVGNAIKFTDEGSIGITVAAENGNFEVEVADTGPGITADEQKKIFEEFHQTDSSNTKEKGGTGLGLAIAKRIVEMHGGQIWVRSAPGEGSTFGFDLPVEATQREAVA
ncbi:MAG: ATP-binding protein [Alphaproteobacteria bacterium]|nr:ATP-binding protein [Alphaproteobacteria bacterium]